MDEGRFILLLIKINKEEKCAVVREVIVRSKFRSVAPQKVSVFCSHTENKSALFIAGTKYDRYTVSGSTKIYSKAIRGLV